MVVRNWLSRSLNSGRDVMKTPGKIRIIAGQWRRRQLPVPKHSGLRPTPDRVRETLFNWIGDGILDSTCLDLFAGTGALGFESASRGAAQVWMLERDAGLCQNLRQQSRSLHADQVQIVHADALAWIADAVAAVDYIFLDPPFGKYKFSDMLKRLESSRLLKPTTTLYYECALDIGNRRAAIDAHGQCPQVASWCRIHSAQAGRVSYNLFQRKHFNNGRST